MLAINVAGVKVSAVTPLSLVEIADSLLLLQQYFGEFEFWFAVRIVPLCKYPEDPGADLLCSCRPSKLQPSLDSSSSAWSLTLVVALTTTDEVSAIGEKSLSMATTSESSLLPKPASSVSGLSSLKLPSPTVVWKVLPPSAWKQAIPARQ